jgi:hypothetical protein
MAGHSGLTMSAYRKFSDTLQSAVRTPAPPKPPKPSKVPPVEQAGADSLGGLGALGGAEPKIGNSAPPLPEAECAIAIGGAEAERAAIVRQSVELPRALLEGVTRLDRDRPRGDVPLKRSQRFVDDVELFLDGPFCAAAVALGWKLPDLCGCDCDRPFARIDQAGLLWLLNGAKVAALTDNTATIKTRIGAPQTWRRKPNEPGRVLAWELAQ